MTTNRMELAPTDNQIKALIHNLTMSVMVAQQSQSFTPTFAAQNEFQIAALRELLARREESRKPVAFIDKMEMQRIKDGDSGIIRTPIHGHGYQDASIPLYAGPVLNAVTVPDEMIIPDVMRLTMGSCAVGAAAVIAKADGWNACRAAMLKSVTNEP